MKRTYLFFIATIISLFFVSTVTVDAATLSFSSGETSLNIGQEFVVDIVVAADEEFINAAQATLQFPTNILKIVSVDRAGSVLKFWVEEPTFSNEDGTLSLIGGTSKGVTGNNLQIIKIKFKTTGAGKADLILTDAVITASDGKGTNILESIIGTTITVGTKIVIPNPETSQTVVVEPQKIVRKAVVASKLPEIPIIAIPLYPDSEEWYSHIGDITALWEVLDDITQVSVTVDKNPNTDPGSAEKELVNGKNLGILQEGIWYVHVQFRNNVGWGKIAHYRISIDATVPLPLKLEIDNPLSDNPTPLIRHETQDALSGISHTVLFVDNKEVKTSSTTIESLLPPQLPGHHILFVKVFDFAGNSVENSLEFEIIPIETPVIGFLTSSVGLGEKIFISGTSLSNVSVGIQVIGKSGEIVFAEITTSDATGNWDLVLDEVLSVGRYTITAIAKDFRSASSYPTEPQKLRIRAKSIISIGFLDLGWFEIFIILVLLVVSGVSFVRWRYVSEQAKSSAYSTIASRDLDKLSELLIEDLKGLEAWVDKSSFPSPQVKTEAQYRFRNIRETVLKMKKYIGQELRKVK